MIDKETAKRLVTEQINAHSNVKPGFEWVVIDEATIENDYGWVFCYQTRLFLETKNNIYRRAGNYPILVEKSDGSLHYLNTQNNSLKKSLELFEEQKRSPKQNNYYELFCFLKAYMATMKFGGFPNEREAIQYYVSFTKLIDIKKVIAQGKEQVAETHFPAEKISTITNRVFKNKEDAKNWLKEVIQLLELSIIDVR
ncbi:hypothetical protein H6S82_12765 [Planktothrix sp. FACHB-1355]|uniref:Immunity protein 35 domain-containing protein n=1 Tax=Aerosakkonema funiforme FACHB-1375 TaxID=2949571 RepID=A0A926VC55_9CYAN|nr:MULTISPECIES: YrhB domain-containing protein [Oscillatoriales]MBD2181093.1 hypothetical protein [Aerosakkonema funiforme FACHB-1375]MBD3559729.1 hypothetical protein [Planktothrix sp. FACHB-1355]